MPRKKKLSPKQTLSALLRRYLSKKSADRIMTKTMRMAQRGVSPAKIQRTIIEMVAADCIAVLGKIPATGTNNQPVTGTQHKRY